MKITTKLLFLISIGFLFNSCSPNKGKLISLAKKSSDFVQPGENVVSEQVYVGTHEKYVGDVYLVSRCELKDKEFLEKVRNKSIITILLESFFIDPKSKFGSCYYNPNYFSVAGVSLNELKMYKGRLGVIVENYLCGQKVYRDNGYMGPGSVLAQTIESLDIKSVEPYEGTIWAESQTFPNRVISFVVEGLNPAGEVDEEYKTLTKYYVESINNGVYEPNVRYYRQEEFIIPGITYPEYDYSKCFHDFFIEHIDDYPEFQAMKGWEEYFNNRDEFFKEGYKNDWVNMLLDEGLFRRINLTDGATAVNDFRKLYPYEEICNSKVKAVKEVIDSYPFMKEREKIYNFLVNNKSIQLYTDYIHRFSKPNIKKDKVEFDYTTVRNMVSVEVQMEPGKWKRVEIPVLSFDELES